MGYYIEKKGGFYRLFYNGLEVFGSTDYYLVRSMMKYKNSMLIKKMKEKERIQCRLHQI